MSKVTEAKKDHKAVATSAASTAIAKSASHEVVPDYIKQGSTRGSENVSTEDITIPRLELVQALSPCLKTNDPAYIEGAKAGMFFNSITRQLYGKEVTVCPVYFKKEWLLWRDRKKGGGFKGAHSSPEAAMVELKSDDTVENITEWEAIETAQQIVLIVRDGHAPEEAVVSMARTKLKVSRQWNSLIRINGGDRFSRLYTMFGIEEQNSVGEDYYNVGVASAGFAPLEVYQVAEAMYDSISTGKRKVNVDSSDTDQTANKVDNGEF